MKIRCDFCQTEYSVPSLRAGAVKCAVCGNTWTPARSNGRGAAMMFFAALCALLSAIVFTVAVITRQKIESANAAPLIAHVTSVRTAADADGMPRLVVAGTVQNVSDEIYGVPDLIITARDANGNIVMQQKFMPSATLLDAGTQVQFSHTLSGSAMGVKRVSVELANMGTKK